MKALVVGGWVRDKLLSEAGYDIKSSDKDWVVVGSTPEEMISLGFVPVGADFPVFLHPDTKEEYALARTERKSGHGYKGFRFYAEPDVSLEDDLKRRDLTINAMAINEDGTLIDPYGGLTDLKNRLLRHVSSAFVEDPLRLLRVARFRSRLPNFKIDPDTMTMLKRMVDSGEVDALVSERVGTEIRKALLEKKPSLFFKVLEETGFLKRVYPHWVLGKRTLNLIDRIQGPQIELKRFAASFWETDPKDISKIIKLLKLPNDFKELAVMFSGATHNIPLRSNSAEEILKGLKYYDALRRPVRFKTLLSILQQTGLVKNARLWEDSMKVLSELSLADVVSSCINKKELPKKIEEARLKALRAVLM